MSEAQARNLSVALRPRRFSEVVGYTDTLDRIRTQFNSGRIPTAMKFTGTSRGGKTTLAKIIGVSVNCSHGDFGEPCDACLALADSGMFNIQEINAANLNKVEDARDLVKEFKWQPGIGSWNVFILDECQQMTKPAQNVILKPLEAEDGFNIVIFCTTDDSDMIVALRKRCGSNQFTLDGLNQQEIKRLVWNTSNVIPREGGWPVEYLAELSGLLWERNILAPGDIVSAVEAASNGALASDAAVSSEFSGKVDVTRLLISVGRGDWPACRSLLALAEPRDSPEILLRVTAYFRYELLKTGNSVEQTARLVQVLDQLTSNYSPIPGMLLACLSTAICNICSMLSVPAKQHGMQRVA